MKQICIFCLLVISGVFSLSAQQVGIGTTSPHASAALDITSTSSGLLISKMTQAQRNAIVSPSTGLLIYQIDGAAGFHYFDGLIWKTFGGGSAWGLTGDAGTSVATDKVGTLDAQDLVVVANNNEGFRVDENGRLGIGVVNPTHNLHLVGTSPAFRLQDGNEALNRVLTSDASGNATWGDSSSLSDPGDQDWDFGCCGTDLADRVYRPGVSVIGRTGLVTPSFLSLDVDNGATTGTTIGIGDVEYLEDGNNETRFSHRLFPQDKYSTRLGSGTKLWKEVWATNGVVQTSDRRMKEEIKNLNYGLEELMQLQPVEYKWKEELVGGLPLAKSDKRKILGLIAQEVQEIMPEIVYDEELKIDEFTKEGAYTKKILDRLAMSYTDLLPVIVKAKQQQMFRLAELEIETEKLYQELIMLKSK
ncbi:MAG: tail fiber domain-containing protein [Flavobacteriaceae bacterium]